MKTIQVKSIMVPVADYAVVQETASFGEALIALKNEHKSHNGGPYRHQSLVVVDYGQISWGESFRLISCEPWSPSIKILVTQENSVHQA